MGRGTRVRQKVGGRRTRLRPFVVIATAALVVLVWLGREGGRTPPDPGPAPPTPAEAPPPPLDPPGPVPNFL